MVLLPENRGDGREEEVEEAVDDGHVCGHEPRNQAHEEHLDGARHAVRDDADRLLRDVRLLVAGAQLGAVELLAQTLGLVAHQHAVVRLLVEEFDAEGHDGRGDQEHPVDPAPAGALGDEAARDGADDGSEEGSQGEDGGGEAALVRLEQVGNDAAADGNASGASDAGKEAEDDESREVRRQGAADLPDDEEAVGAAENDAATVDLGQGREEERADGVAQHEDGDGEDGQQGRRVPELLIHEADAGREHGGGER